MRAALRQAAQRLVDWLFGTDEPLEPGQWEPATVPPLRAIVKHGGPLVEVYPTAAYGMGLFCLSGDGGQHLVMLGHCNDPEGFRRAWEALGGPGQGITDEDGEPVEP